MLLTPIIDAITIAKLILEMTSVYIFCSAPSADVRSGVRSLGAPILTDEFRNKEKTSHRKPRELVPLKSPNSSYQVFWDVNDSLTIPLLPFNLKV